METCAQLCHITLSSLKQSYGSKVKFHNGRMVWYGNLCVFTNYFCKFIRLDGHLPAWLPSQNVMKWQFILPMIHIVTLDAMLKVLVMYVVGLSDTTVLAIYRDIFVSIDIAIFCY